jgi:hypothetical protein
MLLLRAEGEVLLAVARVSYLGSAGCQLAAFGSLPNARGNANTGNDAKRFAASCRELQASGLCSPEARGARQPEFVVPAGLDAEASGASERATGRFRFRSSSTFGNSSRLRSPK